MLWSKYFLFFAAVVITLFSEIINIIGQILCCFHLRRMSEARIDLVYSIFQTILYKLSSGFKIVILTSEQTFLPLPWAYEDLAMLKEHQAHLASLSMNLTLCDLESYNWLHVFPATSSRFSKEMQYFNFKFTEISIWLTAFHNPVVQNLTLINSGLLQWNVKLYTKVLNMIWFHW